MKRNARDVWAVCSLLVVLFASAVYAGATPSVSSSTQCAPSPRQEAAVTVEQQVRAAHQQLVETSRTADKEAARRLMTEEMTWVNNEGKVTTREAMLAGTPAPPAEVTVDRVVTMANVALVTGSARLQSGRRVRFLQEWVNREGQWRLLAHQGTPLATTSEAGEPAPPAGQPAPTGAGQPAPPAPAGTSGAPAMTPSTPTLNSDEERAVWKAQGDIHRAFLAGDTTTYSMLTSDDFLRIAPNGEQQGKSQFLQDVKRNANQTGGQIEVGDAQILVSGDTARVVFTTWGTMPGGQRIAPMRVTRVLVKRGDRWQQAAAVFTPLAQQ